MKNETFTTVAVFQYSTEAQIIKGRLESDGIRVFLSDNLTIDTDPLVSKAIGGIKLKVLSYQAAEAQNILNAIQKYSLDDAGNSIRCPNCKSSYIELFSTIKDLKSLFWFLFGVLFSSLPFYTKHKYRCEMCDTEFDLK
ncbi:DUF2007 domain-containing protein [Gelidibacter maritimus]|uniref:DUF2007 domain-containing protein n=1 Tax=Gelidibacter maritimus TaxID=2761487 RepID=A0A7W2M3P2_9FLAO|nr:DUF2007 domain-containing protein [Gelidibacter maritimus]MBA6152120.1 DUF2007 domain-containing protein [Gelidibacter maritimus]